MLIRKMKRLIALLTVISVCVIPQTAVLAEADDPPLVLTLEGEDFTVGKDLKEYGYTEIKTYNRTYDYNTGTVHVGRGLELVSWNNPARPNLADKEYTISHRFNVPAQGIYKMSVVSTGMDGITRSNYAIKVNDGEYFEMNERTPSPLGWDFIEYDTGLSFRLKAGANVINLKVTSLTRADQGGLGSNIGMVLDNIKLERVGDLVSLMPEGFEYFQNDGTQLKALEYDSERDVYVAEDGEAFISDTEIMPSAQYSLVKRYTVSRDMRYRVRGTIKITDNRGNGLILSIKKNDEQVWQQLFVEGETGVHDIRMLAKAGDVIDLEILPNTYAGFSCASWDLNIEPGVTIPPSTATELAGSYYTANTTDRLFGGFSTLQGASGLSYYAIKRGVKIPMVYDAASNRWRNEDNDPQESFIMNGTIVPGVFTNAVLEWKPSEAGMVRIRGDMALDNSPANATTEDTVIDLYKNDEKIWSNRVGGERFVRWDEPYDITFFLNRIDVAAQVNPGDTFSFVLTRRGVYNFGETRVPFNPEIIYFSGGILSKSTKWKLNQSIVFDTNNATVRMNGVETPTDVFVENGTTYIAAADITALGFSPELNSAITQNGKTYVPLRNTMVNVGKSVVWAGDGLVLVHDGIPVFFGWPELSEISLAMKEGVLFE